MNNPCYCAVLRRAARKLSARYDAALAPAGVNVAQFSMLRAIGRMAPVSLSALGETLELDRSTVGRNVRVLERMGLVVLSSGKDQREVTLSLARKTGRLLERAIPLWEQAQAEIEAELGPGAAALKQALEAL